MQLARARFDIARDAVLADALRFGFASRDECADWLDLLLARIEAAFPQVAHWLDAAWQAVLHERMHHVLALLRR